MQTKSRRRARVRQNRPRKQGDRTASGRLKPEDARKTVIDARLRHAKLPDTPENRKAMADPMQGCAVGRALIAEPLGRDERALLWQAVIAARKAVTGFDRAIGAPDRHAQCLRILVPVDAMSADASSPAMDTRSPEQKYHQAIAAAMRIEQWAGHADRAAQTAFKRHVIDEPDAPIRGWPGVLSCLRCIAEGLMG